MVSILKRPLDLVIAVCFFSFLLIAITIDFTQSLYGSVENMKGGVWPPPQILEAYTWWSKTYDPLLAKNPVWYETMSWFSPFLYAPFYICAIYAFVFQKEWIRVPALMWSYGLLLCMMVTVREELYGEYPAPDRTIFAMAYGGYVLVPILVMFRVAWSPVFSTKAHSD